VLSGIVSAYWLQPQRCNNQRKEQTEMALLPKIMNEELPPLTPENRDEVLKRIEEAYKPLMDEMSARRALAIDICDDDDSPDCSSLNKCIFDMHFWVLGGIRQVEGMIRYRGSLAGALLMTHKVFEDRKWVFADIDELIARIRSAKAKKSECHGRID
jgi:hypothetical protein